MVSCPLKDQNYNGDCAGCNNREYCMMSEIMDKLHSLEAAVAQMKARQVA
jgi:hypothetical protein